MAKLAKVPFIRADLVAQPEEQRLKPYVCFAKTLILNNGKEFSHHQQVDKALGLKIYFVTPTASGTGEIEKTSKLAAQICAQEESAENSYTRRVDND